MPTRLVQPAPTECADDHEARDYLPHMYGAVNWTLADDIARLPLEVADIYRRRTT